MLQAMRSGAKSIFIKFILFGLLVMATLGLAMMDVQGMFRTGNMGNTTVAKIGRQKITAPEFDAIYQRALRQQNITAEEGYRANLPMIVLNQEINSRIYARAAYDLGLIVDNKTAAAELKNLLAPIAAEAKISEAEALNRLLRNLGTSEGQFVNTLKNQMASEQLMKIISGPARAPRQLIDDALKYRYEWRRGEYFTLSTADLGNLPAASEEDLKAHYEAISDEFLLPEHRDFAVLAIDKKAMGVDSKVSAEDVRRYYDEHADSFATGEQRTIEQLIVADEAAAKDLLALAQGGKTFADIAAEAKKAGDSKTTFVSADYSEDEMDIDLAKAAFAGDKDSISGPVKTPLGWHILKVAALKPARVPPFEEMRAAIEQDLGEEIAADAVYKRAQEIDDMIAGGQTVDEVAKAFNLKVQSFSAVTSEGTDKQGKKIETTLPDFAKIVETAYTLDEGNASPLTEASDGSFVIVETRAITKSQEQPYEAVKGEVAESLRQKKIGAAFDEKTAAITEKIQLGQSFTDIARELGKTIQKTDLIQRGNNKAADAVERGILPALFSLDKIGQTTTVAGGEKVTILRLSERRVDPPKEPKAEDVTSLRGMLDKSLQNDIVEQYRNQLMRDYRVSINEEALDNLYRPRDTEG